MTGRIFTFRARKLADLDVGTVGRVQEGLTHQHERDAGFCDLALDHVVPELSGADLLIVPELDTLVLQPL
jgi:hypothetical protein